MSRLPTPGGDDGDWGNILNDYLQVSLNPDGTLKPIPKSELSSSVQNSLNSADSAVQSVNGKTGNSVTIGEGDITNLTSDLAATEKTAHKDQANGYAGLDGSGLIKTAELPGSVLTQSTGTVNVKNYGAKGDGKILYHATMTAGSAVLNSTDSGVNFTNADVGKTIIVSGVAAGTDSLVTTIQSVQSTSQCTLAATATQNSPDPAGVQIAVYGTDDTAAIQAASDAAVAANSGTVLFDSLVYIIAGALQQGGSRKTNSQLTLPNGGEVGNMGRLVWKGARDYSGASGNIPFPGPGGSTLVSTLVGQTYSGTYGVPSVIGGPTYEQQPNNFSGSVYVAEDICVLTARNPSLSAFNLERTAAQNRRRVTAGTLEWGQAANWSDTNSGPAQPTNPWACAFIDPSGSNYQGGSGRSDQICTWGYFAGIAPAEHSNISAYQVFVTKIPIAIRQSFAHAAKFDYVTCQTCPYVISGWDPTASNASLGAAGIVAVPNPQSPNRFPILIGDLDLEDYSDTSVGNFNWTVLVNHINDPNNHLNGRIGFSRFTWASSSFNDATSLVVNGGSRVLTQPNNVGAVQNIGQGIIDALMPWTQVIVPELAAVDAKIVQGTWINGGSVGTDYIGPNIFNSSAAQNDEIGWYMALANGTWNFALQFTKNSSFGILTLNIDGVSAGTIDQYAASVSHNNLATITGISITTPGRHLVSFKAATKNASSSGFVINSFIFQFRRTA